MSEKDQNKENLLNTEDTDKQEYKVKYISGMYKNWFLDYASYVILERAVPHVADGLKPVQRRILHSMKRMDDGRYNKVANIIGHTMQFHPHGDASIGDALVQLGQKELLIDMQGNWGNVLTGDSAAAPRYIEARLSKFALEVVFNSKTTKWRPSYDGRNKEPIHLPVKFPLLLAQGVEGIAVGLASKIMPHNFVELIDASINHLKGKDFTILPDFLTGGLADFSEYNDGKRGGRVKVRAKIIKRDSKTLVITELPFGKNTVSLIDSIVYANDKGKIKIKKIEDNTSDKVEILIRLPSDISSDKMIDALYAVTDCEVSISPNTTVILGDKPKFTDVKEILRFSTDNTLNLLKEELLIRLSELDDAWHSASLEKIFIENRIYLSIEECETWECVIQNIDKGLKPFIKKIKRPVTEDDITRLTEIKIKRISKYDAFKADNYLKSIIEEIEEIKNKLAHIVDYTIEYFRNIKKKYGKGKERRTEIRNFEEIKARKVVVRNKKLYINYDDGFAGTTLKQDTYIDECSDMDLVIIFRKDGIYFVKQAEDRFYVGKDVKHIAVWKKDDERTVYNVIYYDGGSGNYYMKRFFVNGIIKDKEYNLTKGTAGSKIIWFTANQNGEAETIKITHRPRKRLKNKTIEINFSELAIKGRNSMGNIATKYGVQKITLKEEGVSTLGDRQIWFDIEVLRLNAEGRGELLGEFSGDDKILVIYKNGTFQITSFDLSTHFETDILKIEKFESAKVWSAVFFDADQSYFYLKRFKFESSNGLTSFIGDNSDSELVVLSDFMNAQFEILFGGKYKTRANEQINADEFIAVKSIKARGKRLTTYTVKKITEIIPQISETKEDKSEEKTDISETVSEKEKLKSDLEFKVIKTDKDGNQTLFDL